MTFAHSMHFDDYVRLVEEAFGLYGEGKTLKPGMMYIDATDGEFHIKAGSLGLSKPYFALKATGGFFHNMERFGDAERPGCDSALRRKRTGAATAVAAKYLARVESEVVTICGCGTQGRAQLLVMHSMFAIKKAYVLDIVADKAESLARELSRFLEIAVVATANLREAARESDTASPARRRAAITCSRITFRPARSLQPWELTARTNRNSELSSPTKSSWTCWSSARAGELYHALENGMREEDVYAELGDIIIGKEPRRTSKEEVVIFDAIGTTLQDAVAAVAVYQKAFEIDAGLTFDLFR
jgi:alanine dehydrogenase